MIEFRPIELDRDYPTLEEWWKGHGVAPVPRYILPRGWIAFAAGVEIASSFLYVAEKKIAVIEWTTTNPRCALSRDLVEAVKGLYAKLEEVAQFEGCVGLISFVAPNTSEERIMIRMGFVCTPDSKMHRMFAKPVGGTLSCP